MLLRDQVARRPVHVPAVYVDGQPCAFVMAACGDIGRLDAARLPADLAVGAAPIVGEATTLLGAAYLVGARRQEKNRSSGKGGGVR